MVKNIVLDLNTRFDDGILQPVAEHDEKQPETEVKEVAYSFEEAVKLAGHGKYHFFLLLVCGSGLLGVVVENVNIGFVLPYARCDLKFTSTEQGALNAVGYLGIVLSSHFWGFLADTWGRRKVLRISLLGSFLCAILSAFSISVIMLILTRLFVGIFVSGVQAASYSYMGEFHSDLTRTRASAFLAMFMPGSFVYLPLLAWLIIPMNWTWYIYGLKFSPWRLYLLCSSLINGLNFLCLGFFPESPKFLLSMNKKDKALNILKTMYAFNSGNSKEEYPVRALLSEDSGKKISSIKGVGGIFSLLWQQTWPLFAPPHLGNTIKLCYLMFVLFSCGHGTFIWFPDFLTQMQEFVNEPVTLCQVVGSHSSRIFNETSTDIIPEDSYCAIDNSNTLTFKIILMIGVVFVSISSIVSFYIDKVDRKKLLTTWLILSSVVCVAIAFVENFYVMAICFMLFLSCGLCAGIISAISVALFPTNYRAMATCLILMFGRIGAVGGSLLVGLLLETNCDMIFYINAAIIITCVIVCLLLNTKPKPRRPENITES